MTMMLYFVMARHNDARPIIEYFGLKRDMSPCPFPVFMAGDVVLCLSEESTRANTAAATAYLLTRWGRNGVFVHLGRLGRPDLSIFNSGKREGESGTGVGILYPYSISDGNERVYQEMLYKPPAFMHEGHLEDSEGVYAFLAASRFLPLKQIIVLRYSGKPDEGTIAWVEMIYFGMMSFPTSTWKKGQKIT